MICPVINRKITKFILKMSRKKMMYATQILTGHASLKYHLHNMRLVDNNMCEKCGEERETVEHIEQRHPFQQHPQKSASGPAPSTGSRRRTGRSRSRRSTAGTSRYRRHACGTTNHAASVAISRAIRPRCCGS